MALGLLGVCAWGCASDSTPVSDASIVGQVRSDNGPEEGVWVIAETADLPTRFTKIVVTGEGGRFLLPDLPGATYEIWVRGYGLVDSEPVNARPGLSVDLEVVVAANAAEAAVVYPANYWYSLVRPPSADEFPGTGPEGNGIAENLQVQAQWIDAQKQGCMVCHQLGNRVTREIDDLAEFDSTIAAWDHHMRMGQRGDGMSRRMDRFGRERGLIMFADWTNRIAAGATPPPPPRPQGIERNVVLTMWEWGTEIDYIHDQVTTDKRSPSVNANGPVYGINLSNDELAILNPVTHTAASEKIPLRADAAMMTPMIARSMPAPSRFFGNDLLWNNPGNPHNPMMDAAGRVWFTTAIRETQPAWCGESDSRYASYFPLEHSGRQAAYFDPATREFVLIDTCFGTHHPRFARDENDTVYFSDERDPVIGWINTKRYLDSHDERASQGWCPLVLDTNADGRITKPWNEPAGPDAAFDRQRDTRVNVRSYGIVPDPEDEQVIWFAWQSFPGWIGRLDVGDDPPESCVTEVYQVPSPLDPEVPKASTGFGSRGMGVDSRGVVWTALSGSGAFASFDRSRCTVLNGPEARDGRHCSEGWNLYPTPGPTIPNTDPPVAADHHAHNWVDQWNTLGLGRDVPIANGSNSDSLLALLPDTSEWVVLRVPYPLGFFSRGLDGRVDDPDAGWKGRGVWSTYSAAAAWHIEGGIGHKPRLVKFQVRPDPLAD